MMKMQSRPQQNDEELVKNLIMCIEEAVIFRPSIGKRILAYAVDITVALLLGIPFLICTKVMSDQDLFYKLGLTGTLLMLVMLGLIIGFPTSYLAFKDGLFKGRSFGRRVTGLVVTKFDCITMCNIGQSLLRQLPFAVGTCAIPFLGGLFEIYFMMTKPFAMRWGDFLSKTVVLDLERQKALLESFEGVKNRFGVTDDELKLWTTVAFRRAILE